MKERSITLLRRNITPSKSRSEKETAGTLLLSCFRDFTSSMISLLRQISTAGIKGGLNKFPGGGRGQNGSSFHRGCCGQEKYDPAAHVRAAVNTRARALYFILASVVLR